MEVSATEFKNRLGKYLDAARSEPVIVDKTGRKTAVLISYKEYERLVELEDSYWVKRALEAENEGYAGLKKSMAFLRNKHA